jgi:hypothetical protein
VREDRPRRHLAAATTPLKRAREQRRGVLAQRAPRAPACLACAHARAQVRAHTARTRHRRHTVAPAALNPIQQTECARGGQVLCAAVAVLTLASQRCDGCKSASRCRRSARVSAPSAAAGVLYSRSRTYAFGGAHAAGERPIRTDACACTRRAASKASVSHAAALTALLVNAHRGPSGTPEAA